MHTLLSYIRYITVIPHWFIVLYVHVSSLHDFRLFRGHSGKSCFVFFRIFGTHTYSLASAVRYSITFCEQNKTSRLLVFFCLFVWLFDSLRPINDLTVIKGRVFLGWTSTKLGLMFLLKDTLQWRWWSSNPRPLVLGESSTLPLSHCAPSSIKTNSTVCEGLFYLNFHFLIHWWVPWSCVPYIRKTRFP